MLTGGAGVRRVSSWPTLVARLAGLALYLIVVFGPLLVLLGMGLKRLAAGDLARGAVVPESLPWELLIRSAALSLAVAAACVVVGTLVATVLVPLRSHRLGLLRWLVLVLAPVPPYVHALAWSTAGTRVRWWLTDAGVEVGPVPSHVSAWWVETMALLPLAVALALLALETVPDDLVDAARMHLDAPAVWARVVLPLSAPLVLAGGGIVFVLSLLDYTVPALYQVNVYSLAVFAEFSASNDPVRTLIFALPLMGLAAAVVLASQHGLRRVAFRPRRPARSLRYQAPARHSNCAWSSETRLRGSETCTTH